MIRRPVAAPRGRRGFSHVEILVSTLLVGVMVVSATQLLGGVVSSRTATSYAARGLHFAQQLMTEILRQAYIDNLLPVFGPELLESLGTRAAFDDVDDYHGWSESPLRTRTGTVIDNSSGWQRNVVVEWVNPANPSATSATDQGLKRITVTVLYGSRTVSRLVSLRSDQ